MYRYGTVPISYHTSLVPVRVLVSVPGSLIGMLLESINLFPQKRKVSNMQRITSQCFPDTYQILLVVLRLWVAEGKAGSIPRPPICLVIKTPLPYIIMYALSKIEKKLEQNEEDRIFFAIIEIKSNINHTIYASYVLIYCKINMLILPHFHIWSSLYIKGWNDLIGYYWLKIRKCKMLRKHECFQAVFWNLVKLLGSI